MPPSTYEFGRFSLNPAEHRLERDGQPVSLTPRVFDLLHVLVANAGHLIEKDRLLHEVWHDAIVEEANLNRAISVLRKALGENSSERYIETVPKRGYRFVAAIRTPGSAPVDVAGSLSAPRQGATSPHQERTLAWLAAIVGTLSLVGASAAYLTRNHANENARTSAPAASVHRQLTFTGREVAPTVSPDGARIAYVSVESPHRRVIVQDVDGGEPVSLFSAPEAGALRWSPDGSELMFWARGAGTDGLYLAPGRGGAARRISKQLFVTCWSPDGSMIALASFTPQKIVFINTFGDEQRTISLQGSRGWIWDLDWSPARDRLLFVANDETDRPAIWSIDADGSQQTKLLSADAEIYAARWAPGGHAIYYFRRVNQTVSLFKADLRSDFTSAEPSRIPLISGLEADESFGMSTDATRLVYARAPYYSNLWLVEDDPSSVKPLRTTQLTHGTSVVDRPRVSPDGESIVFNMGYESRTNLYTVSAKGGSARQLTFLNAFSVGPVWSAGGESIAFASTEGGQSRVWIVHADGSSPRPLSTADMSDNFNLAWGPGERLLYQESGNRNFYAIDPATDHRELLLEKDSLGFVSSAEYSPDGKRILLYASGPPPGLWVTGREGSERTPIHPVSAPSDSNPVPIGWSPDGTAVYGYDGKRAAARGLSVLFRETVTAAKIVKVQLNSGRPTTVVELPFEEVGGVAMFPDGRRFVASVYSSRSDVWIVENFDSTLKSTTAGR
jgi:Tol biopolymer transport system component/DNA-binding winged helix-turn-helix (wHTH) protein